MSLRGTSMLLARVVHPSLPSGLSSIVGSARLGEFDSGLLDSTLVSTATTEHRTHGTGRNWGVDLPDRRWGGVFMATEIEWRRFVAAQQHRQIESWRPIQASGQDWGETFHRRVGHEVQPMCVILPGRDLGLLEFTLGGLLSRGPGALFPLMFPGLLQSPSLMVVPRPSHRYPPYAPNSRE
jgi:hypothetical protein